MKQRPRLSSLCILLSSLGFRLSSLGFRLFTLDLLIATLASGAGAKPSKFAIVSVFSVSTFHALTRLGAMRRATFDMCYSLRAFLSDSPTAVDSFAGCVVLVILRRRGVYAMPAEGYLRLPFWRNGFLFGAILRASIAKD